MALADNLISYWSLEEASGTRVDAHGANDLSDNNTVLSATGKIGSAADFEAGNSEWLSRASNASLKVNGSSFTIACWVKLETTAAVAILSKATTTSAGSEYLLYHASSRFKFAVYNSGTFHEAIGDNLGAPAVATWYFVVAWHNAATNEVGIAVNGGAANTATATGASHDQNNPLEFGTVSGGNFWDGLIDEVGFWKRVLTSGERTELYNSGAGRGYTYVAPPSLVLPPLTVDGLAVAPAISGGAALAPPPLTVDGLTVAPTTSGGGSVALVAMATDAAVTPADLQAVIALNVPPLAVSALNPAPSVSGGAALEIANLQLSICNVPADITAGAAWSITPLTLEAALVAAALDTLVLVAMPPLTVDCLAIAPIVGGSATCSMAPLAVDIALPAAALDTRALLVMAPLMIDVAHVALSASAAGALQMANLQMSICNPPANVVAGASWTVAPLATAARLVAPVIPILVGMPPLAVDARLVGPEIPILVGLAPLAIEAAQAPTLPIAGARWTPQPLVAEGLAIAMSGEAGATWQIQALAAEWLAVAQPVSGGIGGRNLVGRVTIHASLRGVVTIEPGLRGAVTLNRAAATR